MRDLLNLSLRLLVFSLIAGLLLGGTYVITKEPIERGALAAQDAARRAVLPGAQTFEEVTPAENADADIRAIHRGLSDGASVGYAFSIRHNGYKGPIDMMLGVTNSGAIVKLAIVNQTETAGLGTQIIEPPFLDQFVGIAADPAQLDARVDTITGATISSRAVLSGVRAAERYAVDVLGVVPADGLPDQSPIDLAVVPGSTLARRMDTEALLRGVPGVTSVYECYKGFALVGHALEMKRDSGEPALLGISAQKRVVGLLAPGMPEAQAMADALLGKDVDALEAALPAEAAPLEAQLREALALYTRQLAYDR